MSMQVTPLSSAPTENHVIDIARAYVRDSVLTPALQSHLSEVIKNKVRHADRWLNRFNHVGDLLIYLKRFETSRDDPTYLQMKQYGLLTFEDIVAGFENRFKHFSGDCSRISDFIVGEQYTVYEILILARNYDTRSGGMFLLEANGKPIAAVIKASLSGGSYPNEWLERPRILKYYLKKIGGKFGEHFQVNAAILNIPNLPVITFVRENDSAPFIFHGIFKFLNLLREDNETKAFCLGRVFDDKIANSAYYTERVLTAEIADACQSDRNSRLERLKIASKLPRKFRSVAIAYDRNPDVIAEVLYRAAGSCEGCHQPAPFKRRTDNTPYLEVHHRVQLANNGEDTVENAVALCPNCHRKRHHGADEDPIDFINEKIV